jgi:hypothetical protein
MVLRKIGVLSLAKIAAVIYAFLGLIIGVIVAIALFEIGRASCRERV